MNLFYSFSYSGNSVNFFLKKRRQVSITEKVFCFDIFISGILEKQTYYNVQKVSYKNTNTSLYR